MSDVENFELLVLGSGQGGKLLAWHLAQAGRRVAVIERRWVGGSCPAVACMPSKNEIWSAEVAHVVRNALSFGTTVDNAITDMRQVRDRKQNMVNREVEAHLAAYRESGAELVMGSGAFVDTNTIQVALPDGGSRLLRGGQIVVNVGTHAAVPDVPGLSAARPLTHIEILELDYLPNHLVILGGGYVGIEMAQAFRRLGSRVTIVEPGSQLMAREDPDVANEMLDILRAEGIHVLTQASLLDVTGVSGERVTMRLRTGSGERTIDATDLLVATGRVANTAGIGLDRACVDVDEKGFVRVNDHLQTTAPNIWAIGECAGSPQFTHISVDDFRIVRDNMEGGTKTARDRLVPYVMFTEPPLARIGLSENEAAHRGIAVRVATLPMDHVLRTRATGQSRGWMKVVVDAHSDRILGFTMIGAGAGDVLATVQTAMIAELPFGRLRDAALVHLTFAEGLGPLFARIPARPS